MIARIFIFASRYSTGGHLLQSAAARHPERPSCTVRRGGGGRRRGPRGLRPKHCCSWKYALSCNDIVHAHARDNAPNSSAYRGTQAIHKAAFRAHASYAPQP
eukprot:TRINITY_DN132_c1_g2_i1.p2 TRINITY_DN132_c1_g2~~TRINITY_DN132_c1_g2_i1.p2  ORF type:complete len:102 (+),score=6.84 TRINITY_DN132_c1_g2_i1:261-566(+)